MSREMKTPGPDHPITVEKNPARVTVRVGDQVVADTTAALVLQESNYPPVQYVPLADVDPAAIKPSDTSTYCPFKGDASYFSIPAAGSAGDNAVWTYETPHEAVSQIKEYVAFYPNKVTIEELPL